MRGGSANARCHNKCNDGASLGLLESHGNHQLVVGEAYISIVIAQCHSQLTESLLIALAQTIDILPDGIG